VGEDDVKSEGVYVVEGKYLMNGFVCTYGSIISSLKLYDMSVFIREFHGSLRTLWGRTRRETLFYNVYITGMLPGSYKQEPLPTF
jgi:hypothetical protein